MNNYKKLFGIAGVSLASLMVLSACGGDSDNGSETTDGEVSEEVFEDTGEKVTFVSWLSEQSELDQQVLDAYMEENPDAPEIEFSYVGDNQTANYYQQVDLMLMGGEDIDIAMTSAYAEHAQRASANSYMALDAFFENEGIAPDDEYVSSFMAPVNDNIYGIPGDVKNWIVYINEDMLEEAGLEKPDFDWTWDDYAEYAEAMTTDDTFGSYFHEWDHFHYLNMWSLELGNPIINDEGDAGFDHPKIKEWFEYRTDLEEAGTALPLQTIKATQSTYRDRFFNGEIAMFPIGSFLIAELDDTDSFPHDFRTTFAMMPRDADAPSGRTYAESHYYSIAAQSDNPKGAYDFLRFYTTEGAKIKSQNFPAQEGENKMDYVEGMISDESYLDMEQLEYILTHEDWEDNPNTEAPAYQKQLTDIMVEEAEKYYLGGTDLDEVINNMMDRGQRLIDENE